MADINDVLELDPAEIDKVSAAIGEVGGAATSATGAISDLGRSFSSAFSEATKSGGEMNDSLNRLGLLLRTNRTEIGEFGAEVALTLEPIIGILNKQVDLFGKLEKAGEKAGIGISKSFEGIAPILQMASPKFATFLGRMTASAEHAQDLELSLMRTAVAAGEFDDLIMRAGSDLSQMPDLMARYNYTIEAVSDSTGKLSSQVGTWAEIGRRIPGFMRETIETGDIASTTYSSLGAAITVATGTGQEQSDVMEDLLHAYRQWGTTGQNVIEMIAQIGVVSQDIDVPLDIMRKTVMHVGDQFKMLGDNSQSAINIMSRFGTALRESGLGPEAIGELVRGVTDGVKQLDIAHKSFISAATGGPGGLAGGFQIDLLLKQGKLDRVYDMVQDAMTKQFGGPVVTLEEAATSPALAGELLKQVTFLKEVAGIAKSDEDAYRILEAMKKGIAPTAEVAKTPEEALQEAMDHGNNIQEAQNNKLIELQNKLLAVARTQSQHMLSLARHFGVAERGREMMEAREEAAVRARIEAGGPAEGGDLKERKRAITDVPKFISELRSESSQLMDDLAGLIPVNVLSAIAGRTARKIGELEDKENLTEKEQLELGRLQEQQGRVGRALKTEGILRGGPSGPVLPGETEHRLRDSGTVAPPVRPAGPGPRPPARLLAPPPPPLRPTGEGETSPLGMEPSNIPDVNLNFNIDIRDGIESVARQTVQARLRDIMSGVFTGSSKPA